MKILLIMGVRRLGNFFKESTVKMANKFDIPREAIENIPKITIIGDEELTIENHGGILSFTDNEIIVKTCIGKIILKGTNFEIAYLSETTITVSGVFISFNLERHGDVDE